MFAYLENKIMWDKKEPDTFFGRVPTFPGKAEKRLVGGRGI